MLRKIVTGKKVTEALNALNPISSPVMDEFYPVNIRRQHPFSSIRIDEIKRITKAVPMVMRGTTPVSLGTGSGSINTIEPQPIDVIDTISGAELNNLKSFDGTTTKIWLQDRMAYARDSIRATAEALCIQSLSGAIKFPMKTDTGMDLYEIKFGTILSHKAEKKLNAAGADITTLLDIMRAQSKAIKKKGGGSKIKWKTGDSAFTRILELVKDMGDNSSISVKTGVDSVTIDGKWTIELFDEEYWDPKAKEYKSGIDTNTLKAVAMDGGWAFKYIALDDIEAGLKALPLFSKAVLQEIPSAWVINTMSKPLPIPNPNSICNTTVL